MCDVKYIMLSNEENDSFKHLIVANHSQNKLLTRSESLNIRAKCEINERGFSS